MYQSQISPESKIRSSDRVLKLEVVDGKKPMSSMGMVDPRLFKDGEDSNRLHAVMDTETTLWHMKYEKGDVPAALKGQFTGFRQLYDHANRYFATRNVKITEVN